MMMMMRMVRIMGLVVGGGRGRSLSFRDGVSSFLKLGLFLMGLDDTTAGVFVVALFRCYARELLSYT